jgi:hypothetical protein
MGRRKRYTVEPLRWPEADVALEAAIGRVFIAWSVLDREIDDALRLVMRSDPHSAGCVTANLGSQAKLDIFLSLVHSLFHIADDDCEADQSERMKSAMRAYQTRENAFVQEVERLVGDTRKKAVEFRNWLAHGQPHLLKACEHLEYWVWAKQSARKGGVKVKLSKFTCEPFDAASADIRELVDRWHELAVGLPRRLEIVDLAEADLS